ncbi:MAG: Hpt domain-containing protein [bacterium]|nr:Hpt domain-containing protein [bacterium]
MTDLQGLIINETIPGKLKTVFLRETHKKLETLRQIMEADDVEARKDEIYVIAHGLKGYTGYVGLPQVADVAAVVCKAIGKEEPVPPLDESVGSLAELLKKILDANDT